MQDAFLAGLHSAALMIGVVCLTGAVAAVAALPGRVPPPRVDARPDSGDFGTRERKFGNRAYRTRY